MKRFMWVCKVWLWKDIVVALTLLLLPNKILKMNKKREKYEKVYVGL